MRAKRPALAALAIVLTATTAAAQSKKPQAPAAPPPAATSTSPEPDLVYGAFQRGMYRTAFAEATKRIEEKSDIKAMTLLAELYADGLGVQKDEAKAADWYRIAAGRGDREAMFAL